MVDTESTGLNTGIQDENGDAFVYDIGFAVVDRHANIIDNQVYSFVVSEVFFGMRDKMQSAYYSWKIPEYMNDIESGKRNVARFFFIQGVINQLIVKYNIRAVVAHNMRFDNGALNFTTHRLSKGLKKYFFPYGVDKWCTLAMARSLMYKKPVYKAFCQKYGFTQKNGTPRLTAEILFRFITNQTDFEEKHTGIEDVMIEKEILAYFMRQHKKMKRHYWNEEKRG